MATGINLDINTVHSRRAMQTDGPQIRRVATILIRLSRALTDHR